MPVDLGVTLREAVLIESGQAQRGCMPRPARIVLTYTDGVPQAQVVGERVAVEEVVATEVSCK